MSFFLFFGIIILETIQKWGMTVRKIYHDALKKVFCEKLLEIRSAESLTQTKMANALLMDERSYVDLEHGKTGCSGVTLALFLIYICKDVPKFLADLYVVFESSKKPVV